MLYCSLPLKSAQKHPATRPDYTRENKYIQAFLVRSWGRIGIFLLRLLIAGHHVAEVLDHSVLLQGRSVLCSGAVLLCELFKGHGNPPESPPRGFLCVTSLCIHVSTLLCVFLETCLILSGARKPLAGGVLARPARGLSRSYSVTVGVFSGTVITGDSIPAELASVSNSDTSGIPALSADSHARANLARLVSRLACAASA